MPPCIPRLLAGWPLLSPVPARERVWSAAPRREGDGAALARRRRRSLARRPARRRRQHASARSRIASPLCHCRNLCSQPTHRCQRDPGWPRAPSSKRRGPCGPVVRFHLAGGPLEPHSTPGSPPPVVKESRDGNVGRCATLGLRRLWQMPRPDAAAARLLAWPMMVAAALVHP